MSNGPEDVERRHSGNHLCRPWLPPAGTWPVLQPSAGAAVAPGAAVAGGCAAGGQHQLAEQAARAAPGSVTSAGTSAFSSAFTQLTDIQIVFIISL